MTPSEKATRLEYSVTPSVAVRIDTPSGHELRSRFLEWTHENRILPVGGFLSVGPGWVAGVYEKKDAEKIEDWLAARFRALEATR